MDSVVETLSLTLWKMQYMRKLPPLKCMKIHLDDLKFTQQAKIRYLTVSQSNLSTSIVFKFRGEGRLQWMRTPTTYSTLEREVEVLRVFRHPKTLLPSL